MAIIAILAGIGSFYYADYTKDAKMATLKQNLILVREAISKHFQDKMVYPTDLNVLRGVYLNESPQGLLLLPVPPSTVVVQVEVPDVNCSDNAFLATQTVWENYDFAAPNAKQKKNVKLRIDGADYPW